MELNTKKIIIATVIIFCVFLSLYLYTKHIFSTDSQKDVLLNTPAQEEVNKSLQQQDYFLEDFSKTFDYDRNPNIIKPIWVITPKINKDFESWINKCIVMEKGDFFGFKKFVKNKCPNKVNFNDQIYPEIFITLNLENNLKSGESFYYGEEEGSHLSNIAFGEDSSFNLVIEININGRSFVLPKNTSLIAIENTQSILITVEDNCGPDGCSTSYSYFNGKNIIDYKEIVKNCIPEKYNKLGFGYDIGGFGFEINLYSGYIQLYENTYDSGSAYGDIFNNLRVRSSGMLIFDCKTPNLTFSVAGHSNSEDETIDLNYKQQFLDFLYWVYDIENKTLLDQYNSWSNNIEIKNQKIKYPNDFKIEKREIVGNDDDSFRYRLFNDKMSISFRDSFFETSEINYSFSAYDIEDYYKEEKIEIEILKILYVIKQGLLSER